MDPVTAIAQAVNQIARLGAGAMERGNIARRNQPRALNLADYRNNNQNLIILIIALIALSVFLVYKK